MSPAFLLPGLHFSRSLFLSETPSPDFPAGPAVKNLPAYAGMRVRPPSLGRPHEPRLLSLCPGARAPHQEKPSSSAQLEKALSQQW